MSGNNAPRRWRLRIDTLEVSARIGINPGEADREQPLRIDLRIDYERGAPAGPGALVAAHADDDRTRAAVCYDTLAQAVTTATRGQRWELVEDLAAQLLAVCLADHRVSRARVRIRKREAVANASAAAVEVTATARSHSGSA